MIDSSVAEVEKSNVISLDQKREEKNKKCDYCFESHDYSEEECLDKIWVLPEILYIHSSVGSWSNPLAEGIILNPNTNIYGYENEDTGEIEFDTLYGNLLRVSLTAGNKSLCIVFLVNSDEEWEKLGFGPVSETLMNSTVKQDVASMFLLYGNIFGYCLNKDCDWAPGILQFRDTEYGQKFFEAYDLIKDDVTIDIFSPDVVIHYDSHSSKFYGYST